MSARDDRDARHAEDAAAVEIAKAQQLLAALAHAAPSLDTSLRPRRPTVVRSGTDGSGAQRLGLVEARYRALLEQIPAVTFLASLTGGQNEIYVSPQIETLLGFRQDEWVDDPILWYRQVHRDDRARLSAQFANACATGGSISAVVRVYTRAGELVWIHTEARFVRDEYGEALYLQGVGFDITEQRRAQETRDQLAREQEAHARAASDREWLHGMFSSLPAAIAVLRGRGLVVEFMNPSAHELFGIGAEALGRPLPDVLPDVPERLLDALERVFETGVPYRDPEWSAPGRSDELSLDLSCQLLRGPDRAEDALLIHSTDVTAQVRARREISEALQLREDFLGVAAHELRNPVNSLGLGLELLEVQLRAPSVPAAVRDTLRTGVHRARGQVGRLTRLIENLLDVSRITAGRLHLELEDVDLTALAREVAEAAEAGDRLIVVEANGPVVGRWDRLRLEQVVTNLLGNALEYGRGRPVTIAVRGDAAGACLSVRDEGVGLSADEQARIFDKFERAASRAGHGGLGLGLWITRQIVEALGGTIRVASVLDEGSTFTVELPRRTDAC